MKLATHVIVSDASSDDRTTKRFTSEEFRRIQRSSHFVGSVSFWRALEQLANPEWFTCLHAMGVLREMAHSNRVFKLTQHPWEKT